MGAQKWFKFYGQEYLSDPKIERLTPTERSCWITLLCMASLSEGVIRFLTVESLLNRSGIQFDPYHPEEWEKGLGVLRKFQDLEMIECQDNGDIILLNWEKRQETNLTDAERARNYRDRKKAVTKTVTDNVTNVTLDKNRIDKNRIDNIKGDKVPCGEFKNVLLSQDEMRKLVERYGRTATIQIVEELSSYMKSKGKVYRDHYATLLNWAKRKGVVEKLPPPPPPPDLSMSAEEAARAAQKVSEITKSLSDRKTFKV